MWHHMCCVYMKDLIFVIDAERGFVSACTFVRLLICGLRVMNKTLIYDRFELHILYFHRIYYFKGSLYLKNESHFIF